MVEICVKCGNNLKGKQIKYCSERCRSLYLKSQYRKRNREKLSKYSKEYKNRWRNIFEYNLKTNTEVCFFCHTLENLHWHHIVYKPAKVVRVCQKCHRKLHILKEIENEN